MMARIAMEYMELMGIKDTQFLLVRHFDNGNPHCHLVYNRINNEVKTISDQNDFRRNEQVTKQLKRKYGLTFSKGKGRTKTGRLRGQEKTRYEIYRIVLTAIIQSKSWQEFEANIKKQGVEVEIVMRRRGSRDIKDIQGLRFTKDRLTFKASQIKRDLTFANIVRYLDGNAKKEQEAKTAYQQTRQNDQPRQEPNSRQEGPHEESHQHSLSPSIGIPSLGLFDTTNPVNDPEDEEFRRRLQQQKKKKKRGPRM